MRPGADPRERDERGGKKKQRASPAVKRRQHGGEAEHVRGVRRGQRFAHGGERLVEARGPDVQGQAESHKPRGRRGQVHGTRLGQHVVGALAADELFQRIDQTALHDPDRKKQADEHGPRAETAAPENEKTGQNEKGHPKIETGKHDPETVQPGQATVRVEEKKDLLIERRCHVW